IEGFGHVLVGRCRPYGETTGYDAFGQQVRQLAGILETDSSAAAEAKLRERLSAMLSDQEADEVGGHLAVLVGLSAEGAPDKPVLFYSARRFAEALARETPTVLAFEDIHWAQPSLL